MESDSIGIPNSDGIGIGAAKGEVPYCLIHCRSINEPLSRRSKSCSRSAMSRKACYINLFLTGLIGCEERRI